MAFDLTDPAIPRLVVTGHPNHELAIFGFVQRARPQLLFLTDGGGPERVAESRSALASIGLLDRAQFLDWSEQALYDALLGRDSAVFEVLLHEIRMTMKTVAPQQVICESVELYNPLHDITLPLVRAAAAEMPGVDVIEFPLIAQEPAAEERYRVQRFPDDRKITSLELTDEEVDAKLRARDHEYRALQRSTGDVVNRVSRDSARIETFARAMTALPEPGRDHVLRYEWRGRLLRERGAVADVITFADHYVPFVRALVEH